MRRRTLIFVLACTAAAAHAADVYKWTDANGVVHYADSEPAGDVKAELLHVAGRITPETTAERDARVEDASGGPTATATATATQNAGASTPPATGGAEARCQRARSELELLQSGRPVALAGGGGALDEAARQRQIARAQATIARDCK